MHALFHNACTVWNETGDIVFSNTIQWLHMPSKDNSLLIKNVLFPLVTETLVHFPGRACYLCMVKGRGGGGRLGRHRTATLYHLSRLIRIPSPKYWQWMAEEAACIVSALGRNVWSHVQWNAHINVTEEKDSSCVNTVATEQRACWCCSGSRATCTTIRLLSPLLLSKWLCTSVIRYPMSTV